MIFFRLHYLLMAVAMLAAAYAGAALKPTRSLAVVGAKIDFETLIPKQFGDWRMDQAASLGIVDPQMSAELNEIYSQTLMRTYTNSQGKRIMLSIAYGDNQNRKLQVHRPEVCYAAQGYNISAMSRQVLKLDNATIPIMHMVAQQGARVEPITYWVLIGNKVVRGNLEQGFARLSYGLSGVIPDGLLFRVSTISDDAGDAYATEQAYVNALMQSLPVSSTRHLIGELAI